MAFNLRFPIALTHSLIPLIVLIIALLAALFEQQLADKLVYHRNAIADLELWRFLSGHFLHTNFAHFVLNASAIILLWSLHGQFYSISQYLGLFLFSAMFTSFGLYWFSPDLMQYVGLSGILHGIFVWGAIMDIKHQDKTGYLLFFGVWLKVVYEQIFGASQEVSQLIDANVAIDAHLWGTIAGTCYALISLGSALYKHINKLD